MIGDKKMKNMFKIVIAGAVAASIGAVVSVVIKKIVKRDCIEDCDACCEEQCPPPRSRREILTEDFDVPALREEAKSLGVKRVWRMKKADLIDAIISAETTEEDIDTEYIDIECSDDLTV